MVIFNEKQETMFDTALTKAVDNFMGLHKELKRIKEVLPKAEKELFSIMQESNLSRIHIQDGPTLEASVTDIKEKIKVKENDKHNVGLKPKDKRQKRFID